MSIGIGFPNVSIGINLPLFPQLVAVPGYPVYYYQPRETIVRQHFQQQGTIRAPVPTQRGRQEEPQVKSPRPQDIQHAAPHQQGGPAAPHSQPPQRGGENFQKSAPDQNLPQQRGPAVHGQRQQPGAVQHEQQAPRSQGQEQRSQDRGESQEPKQGHG